MRFLNFFLLFIFFSSSAALIADENHEESSFHELYVCNHSLETLDWVVDFIGSAEQSVEISAPFFGGAVGRKIMTALGERMKERPELTVHLLTHPLLFVEEDLALLNDLKRAFPKQLVVIYSAEVPIMSPRTTAIHNHIKLVIVDEQYVAMGGTNFDDRMCAEGTFQVPRAAKRKEIDNLLPAGCRDSDVVIKGDIAKELRKIFFKLFAVWENYQTTKRLDNNPENFAHKNRYWALNEEKGRGFCDRFEQESHTKIYPQSIRAVFSGSMDAPNKITTEYCKMLSGAQKKVVIGNLFFNPAPALMAKLMETASRNVSMTLHTNGIYDGVTPANNSCFCWANRINYVPFMYGRNFRFWQASDACCCPVKNVRIYEYHVGDILYHKKAMVVDDRYLVIGSYNFGVKSDMGDYELILVIDSPEACEHQMEVFKKDQKYSKEITPTTARNWYFDPWISYLGGSQRQCHGIF